MDDGRGQEEYIRRVVEGYRNTPGTMGTVRRADRMQAAQLYHRGVSLTVIENALVLAAARRLMRPADAPPLGTIRSLAYFLPVIDDGRADAGGEKEMPGRRIGSVNTRRPGRIYATSSSPKSLAISRLPDSRASN